MEKNLTNGKRTSYSYYIPKTQSQVLIQAAANASLSSPRSKSTKGYILEKNPTNARSAVAVLHRYIIRPSQLLDDNSFSYD